MMLIIGLVGGVVGSSIAEFTAALPDYQERLYGIVQGALSLIAGLMGDDTSFADLGELIDPGWAMGFAANILNGLQDVLTAVSCPPLAGRMISGIRIISS